MALEQSLPTWPSTSSAVSRICTVGAQRVDLAIALTAVFLQPGQFLSCPGTSLCDR